tara:strand:+ start:1715 stop:2644 length:930 start_codon:yes stop_codon:yes gene_type:complete
MNLEPINQKNLFGLNNFLLNFVKLYQENKLPNKILLSGDKGLGKSTLAFHLVNYIFSKNEEFKYDLKKFQINSENRSFKLTKNRSNPNFTLIDFDKEKKNIDIGQIRDLILNLNKSSFNNKERFVVIDNIESLNVNANNALLKILEEPPLKTFFILINNDRFILPTLKSRCINFKIFLDHDSIISVTNKLIGENIFQNLNSDLLNYYSTPGSLYKIITFLKSNNYDLKHFNIKDFLILIIKENLYKKDLFIKNITFEYIELFLRKKITFLKYNTFDYYSYFLKRINDTKKFNLDEESLFLEFEHKVLNG